MESPKKPDTSGVDPLVLNLNKQVGLLVQLSETQQKMIDMDRQVIKTQQKAIIDLQNRLDKLNYKIDKALLELKKEAR